MPLYRFMVTREEIVGEYAYVDSEGDTMEEAEEALQAHFDENGNEYDMDEDWIDWSFVEAETKATTINDGKKVK